MGKTVGVEPAFRGPQPRVLTAIRCNAYLDKKSPDYKNNPGLKSISFFVSLKKDTRWTVLEFSFSLRKWQEEKTHVKHMPQ